MAGMRRIKLADAIARPRRGAASAIARGGKPVPDHETVAEEAREARESARASSAQASIRDRMVQIGRGNQQAARQGS